MGRPPGRPKVKNGERVSVYLSVDAIKMMDEFRGSLSRSEFLDALISNITGEELFRYMERVKEVEKENKELRELNERLKREKEHLEKKIEKQEEELEKWRAKWKGQTTLTKYEKKNKEMLALVEKIREHIEEGKTWREVARDAGFIIPGDQIDLLWKIFRKKNNWELESDVIGDWKLVQRGNEGYFGYVFKAIKSSGRAQALGEKTFVEVST